jgi:hypothetical protein
MRDLREQCIISKRTNKTIINMYIEALCVALVGAWLYDSYSKNSSAQELTNVTQTKTSPQIIESAVRTPVLYAGDNKLPIPNPRMFDPLQSLLRQQAQNVAQTQAQAAAGVRVISNPAPVPTIMHSIVPLPENVTNSFMGNKINSVGMGHLGGIPPIFRGVNMRRGPLTKFTL